MCGVAGVFDRRAEIGAEILDRTVAEMTATMVHLGPDDEGRWSEPAAGRCHVNRRLTSLWAPTPELTRRSLLAAIVSSRRLGIGGVFGGRLSTVSCFPTGPIVPFDLPGRFNIFNYSLFAIYKVRLNTVG